MHAEPLKNTSVYDIAYAQTDVKDNLLIHRRREVKLLYKVRRLHKAPGVGLLFTSSICVSVVRGAAVFGVM